ncbi:MBL fold metallo-hydrolase [Pedobacter heparinus]|uniref:Beta-lactamase domain protein n=1 Tax=Pedobacter heparinus (strain ATCC 13125 / DSM 2366 / CIP 104194 / JCM 7457 / NBRC 12017 / NCIMB 9290 / NRRL B-14731 / HIM 762-3) TaxID=485917 RepID=C6Y1J1_PEDHD|nr:MBL fold metallo-hydrolase [Pedobacter heparinus]ACU02967.1 beta-lactamase domain protein [Pedobacter heparinus DSM 2366]
MDCKHLFIASLNSGSNGNCYYVGNEREAILVDVGISCRETEKRMFRLGLSMQKVKAIFISHEHTDHVKGLCTLAAKYNLPVYISPGTLSGCRFNLREELINYLNNNETIQIGSLTVTGFLKIHDASEPYSFVVACGETKVGVFTDIGEACDQLIFHFRQCHAAFLEANYDDALLEKSAYPYFLKKRISGGKGHLSNKKALDLFSSHRPAFMTHLLLAHLSKDNNCPDLALELFRQQANGTEIIVASRYEETQVYTIFEPAAAHSF